MPQTDPTKQPYHIIAVTEGQQGFHSGYEDEATCDAALSRLNTEANRMGLTTIYKMVNEPYA